MALDALTLATLGKELNNLLACGRIERISMPDKDDIVLSVKKRGEKSSRSLLLCASPADARVCVCDAKIENPLNAPAFLMHLRKHIGGGVITSITSVPHERVLKISVDACDELGYKRNFILYAELVGRFSNIILVDEKGVITDAIKRVYLDTFSARAVISGTQYSLPPSQENKISVDDEKFCSVVDGFTGGKLADYLLSNLYGYAPITLRQAIFDAFGTVTPLPTQVVGHANDIKNALLALENAYAPCCLSDNGKPTDFFVTPYTHTGGEFTLYDTLSSAIEAVYSARKESGFLSGKATTLKTALRSAIKKNDRSLSILLERIRECANFEQDKINGELITANMFRIKKGCKCVEVDDYYTGEKRVIDLDDTLTPQQNAQKFYKLYAKKKTAISRSNEQAELHRERADYLESLSAMLDNAEKESDLVGIEQEMAMQGIIKQAKSKKKEKPSAPLSLTVDGYKVLIGKNNIQNDSLVRSSDGGWLWLHAQKIHGSHAVIQATSVPQEVINKVASFVAHFSKASLSSNVPIDYTLVKFVKKPSGSPPGKVIYTHQQTVNVTPQKP